MGSEDDQILLVANTASNSLTYIDINNNYSSTEIKYEDMLSSYVKNKINEKTLNIGTHQIFKSLSSNSIYTVNSYGNNIFKINIAKKEIEDIVYVGSYPSHIDIYNGNIYVTNSDSNSISIIDEKNFTLTKNIPVGEKPHDIKVDKLRNKIYIANSNGYSVTIIDVLNNEDERVLIDIHPLHFYILDENMFILACQSNGMEKSSISLFNLDKKRVFRKIYIDDSILDMSVLLSRNIIFTTNAGDGYLYKIDFERKEILDKIFIGGMPNNILWDKKNKLYISNTLKNIVSVFDINKNKIIKDIPVGNEPNGLILV